MNLSRTIWATSGVVMILTSSAYAQQAGSLRGVLTDREFGTPIAGATVTIVETGFRTKSNEQGNFVFSDVAPGRYTVTITKDGFVRQVKQDVLVSEGQLADLDVELSGEFQDMDEFLVQEIEVGGTESALLKLRLDSPQLLDSVGAELMAKAGVSDAAAALQLVPGATVQDGKYAVIRGLPDRYVSAQLEGVRLPTADAERRAVQLDQFPTAVLSSVQVSKTFTPDQQGDASGGAVNIDLKDIPDETGFELKSQLKFNSQSSFNDQFLKDPRGSLSFWGNDPNRSIPTDLIGQSWPDPIAGDAGSSPTNYKWSASGGGKWELDEGVKIGAFGSLFYERDSAYYDNGVNDSWMVNPVYGVVPEFSQGSPDQGGFQSSLLDVTQGSQSVQWGTLGSVGIETKNHKVGATFLYTNLAVDTAYTATNTRGKEYFTGPQFDPNNPPYDPNDPAAPGNTSQLFWSPYQRYDTVVYTENTTSSGIFKGEHKLILDDGEGGDGFFQAPLLDWRLSYSQAVYDQPDKTQMSAQWLPPSNEIDPSLPGIWLALRPAENSNLGWMQHIWEKITEDSTQVAVNLKMPFKVESERTGYFKWGVFADQVSRVFTQQTYSNAGDPNQGYIGGWKDPWSQVWQDEDHPIVGSIYDVDYNGQQNINAIYGMVDVPLGEQFNVIGGARLESTRISTQVFGDSGATWFPPGAFAPVSFADDPTAADVNFNQDDILPSIGGQWKPTDKWEFRVNFAQTIARQTFRELTPILQQEYLGGPIFIGNPDLQMSALNNYDLRADYTPHPGWLFSGSTFYKTVDQPIEYAQFNAPQNFFYTSPVNYPSGWMLGFELEARLKLGEINPDFNGFSVGTNATFIRSEVTLPQQEADDLAAIGFAEPTRDMTATPAYILNGNVMYEWEKTGTSVALFYIEQGDTLVAGAGTARENYIPSIYATPHGVLNFTLQQNLSEHWKFFFQAKNLLNPEIQTVYRSPYLPSDIVNTSYTAGVDFVVGLNCKWVF